MAEALGRAAGAALDWAGVTFDHAKTQTMFLSKRRGRPAESVRVGEHGVPFNRHAARWLGVWVGSKVASGNTALRG